jgi:hypothetical protein
MKRFKNLALIAAGALICLAIERSAWILPVHAQTKLGSESVCSTQIPKLWGSFKGASQYGVAFEDDNGKIRFIKSLSCGDSFYMDSSMSPQVDMIVERR